MGDARKEAIREMIIGLGADLCGFADMMRFSEAPEGFRPADIFSQCKSVISFGIALPKGAYEANQRLIYGHFNGMLPQMLDEITLKGAKAIEREYAAICVPVPSDAPYDEWDQETLTGHGILSMKHLAVAVGLGTLGKNTLLLNEAYGNRLSVGAILTDLSLEPDDYAKSICIPQCRKCIEACPVNAVQEGHVDQKLCRTNTYGKTKKGYDAVNCKNCRNVCPRRFGIL